MSASEKTLLPDGPFIRAEAGRGLNRFIASDGIPLTVEPDV
ncbi:MULTISPECIES: hypothetical protein [unclassified Enterobacter]|nr:MULTISPECIES: hypothetical protein [unclassified Enterobacter]MEA3561551.1 hypothetical protein [Enterobacter sp. GM-22]MEA3595153.1 hypothetical protein [Enterobacter sp. GM-31]